MTVQLAENILLRIPDVKIAYSHRFAGDRGTILRLDNYAMINIFDDGRYYIQGSNTGSILAVFSQVEKPWDPDTWDAKGPDNVLPWLPGKKSEKRFEP